MGWVRVDDAFYDHEKFQAAGPLGVAQWIAGLAWANRNLSDGFIPVSASRRLLDWEGVSWRGWSGDIVGGADEAESDEISDHLVDCLLWEKTLGGYQIHDYHDFQPTAEKIKGDRANNAARQAAWRANAGSGTASNETRNGVTNAETPPQREIVNARKARTAPGRHEPLWHRRVLGLQLRRLRRHPGIT
jgi:hypothetical protein